MSEVKRFRKSAQLDARSAVSSSKTHGQLKRRLTVRAVKLATNSISGSSHFGPDQWAAKRRHRANALKTIRKHSTGRAHFRSIIKGNMNSLVTQAANHMATLQGKK